MCYQAMEELEHWVGLEEEELVEVLVVVKELDQEVLAEVLEELEWVEVSCSLIYIKHKCAKKILEI